MLQSRKNCEINSKNKNVEKYERKFFEEYSYDQPKNTIMIALKQEMSKFSIKL